MATVVRSSRGRGHICHPERFCYICGREEKRCPKLPEDPLHNLYRAFEAYFGLKVKVRPYTPSSSCATCRNGLLTWYSGKRKGLTFKYPMKWLEPTSTDDCYFCVNKRTWQNCRGKKMVYVGTNSAILPVPRGPDDPLPISPLAPVYVEVVPEEGDDIEFLGESEAQDPNDEDYVPPGGGGESPNTRRIRDQVTKELKHKMKEKLEKSRESLERRFRKQNNELLKSTRELERRKVALLATKRLTGHCTIPKPEEVLADVQQSKLLSDADKGDILSFFNTGNNPKPDQGDVHIYKISQYVLAAHNQEYDTYSCELVKVKYQMDCETGQLERYVLQSPVDLVVQQQQHQQAQQSTSFAGTSHNHLQNHSQMSSRDILAGLMSPSSSQVQSNVIVLPSGYTPDYNSLCQHNPTGSAAAASAFNLNQQQVQNTYFFN